MDYTLEIPDGFDLGQFLSIAAAEGKLPSELSVTRETKTEKDLRGAGMGFSEIVQILNANPIFFGLLLTAIVDFSARILNGKVSVKFRDSDGPEENVTGSVEEVKKIIIDKFN